MRNQKLDNGCGMAGDLFAPLIRDSDDIYISLNSDMIIEYVSPAVERVLGYRPEEVTGRSAVLYIWPEDLSRIGVHLLPAGQEDEAEDESTSARHVAEATADYHANFGVREIRVRHRDDRYLWLKVTFSIERDARGAACRTVAVGRDITDQKQMEEELLRSRTRMKLAQRLAGIGCFRWYPDTNELYWSDELFDILGYKRSDFTNEWEAYQKLVHPEDEARLMAYIHKRRRRGMTEELKYEYRITAPDGSLRTLQMAGTFMYDEGRKTDMMIGCVRDVTIEHRTEELLRTSEKLKMAGQLAAGIAHEIRNPLTSLKGFSKLLCRATGEQADRYYEIMDQEFVRIEMILGELLVLAKPQASVYQDWDIRLIVHEVADLLSSQAILNNVIIQEQATPDACIVRCDKNQLKQVFMNVVKNAIEAMPSGGLLLISIEREEEDVVVHIIDQGGGIPEEQLRRLGEPFFTTKEKGTGLGLMISQKIVEEHEGEIRYASRSGEGTTVSIRLPLSSMEHQI